MLLRQITNNCSAASIEREAPHCAERDTEVPMRKHHGRGAQGLASYYLSLPLLCIFSTPLIVWLLSAVGFSFTDTVWKAQLLIGVGILAASGLIALELGRAFPKYFLYAAAFLIAAWGLWALEAVYGHAFLAQTLSACISVIAIMIWYAIFRVPA